ncbi:MAG: gamma-glutamylcyclotransferase family protein [Pseudomonadota bacterium]
MSTNLFTYGSLMCSDIMYHVAGCRSDFIPAILKDFKRSRIRGEEYPGIVAQPGAEVAGVLYLNLPPEAMERLDSFEGEQYCRQEVQLVTEHFPSVTAMAYVITHENHNLLTGENWSYEHFLAVGKDKFITAYIGFKNI